MPLTLLLAGASLVVLDAAARRLGVYAATAGAWPAGWRAAARRRRRSSPYREDDRRAFTLVVRAGIPRPISTFLPPVALMTFFWSFAVLLALGDLPDVWRGTRSLPFVLASLSLCVAHVLAGVATLVAAVERRVGLFGVAGTLGFGLDAALACTPLPCSDVRLDDVWLALAGGAAQAALMLGFAASLWLRRGLVASDDVPPDATRA